MNQKPTEISDALDLATKAGYILLQNGAEISRVEETMNRIAKYFGVDAGNFFILSTGIFCTGNTRNLKKNDPNFKPEQFADVKYIPLKGSRLDKVVEINQLSREIEQGMYTLEEANEKLDIINQKPPKKAWIQTVSSGVGSFFFCSLFGGGLRDCMVSFVAGLILWIFVMLVSHQHISKLLLNLTGAVIATAVCVIALELGLGVSLGHMIIGSVIPLIPGIAFTIGIRDLVDEDYLAGATRLIDAVVVFFGIAMGVAITLLIYSRFIEELLNYDGKFRYDNPNLCGSDNFRIFWNGGICNNFWSSAKILQRGRHCRCYRLDSLRGIATLLRSYWSGSYILRFYDNYICFKMFCCYGKMSCNIV